MPDALAEVLHNPHRLAALNATGLLDGPANDAFDRLTALAARILDAPVALVSLVDSDRQVFASCLGLPEPWVSSRETPLSHSFCQHTLTTGAPLVISDARDHPLVLDNLAIRDLQVIAYAGIPLVTGEGQVLGSFCVIDHQPRQWTEREIGILRDLAHSVLTEIRLLQSNEQLEAQVLERTRELEVARAAALESSQLKSEFLAAINHEFRTPMTSIMGWTDLVLETELTDEQQEHLQIVRRSADDLFTLLSDILDLAALTVGRPTLVTGDVQPHLLVMEAARRARARAAAKELALRTHVDPAVPRVLRGDVERLRHVLRHLLDNAVKFTDHGEVTVSVTMEEAGKGQVHLRFAVHDTGIGIAEADRRRLFQPFMQGDSSHIRRYRGTGIGLAIVRHLVDLMGGEVELESVVGQGSTFSFTVPLTLAGTGSS